MRKDKNPALAQHFEKLRAILPEIYMPKEYSESEKLVGLLKHSLTIIEALYIQHPESFTIASSEAYSSIISELRKIGHSHQANDSLVQRAAALTLSQARLPMERAGGMKSDESIRKTS